MVWKIMLSHPVITVTGAVWLVVWKMWQKELQDYFKGCSTHLWAWAFRTERERRETQIKAVLSMGLGGLQTLLYLILDDYDADRVTVTRYELRGDGHWATCVAEVRQADMQSVEQDLQQVLVNPVIWDEVVRIHGLPGRWNFVPDVRLLDNVALRDALLSTGVRSAYYHSLPSSKNRPWAVLAISWATKKALTDEQFKNLHSSGIACATVLMLMETANPATSK